MSCESNQPFSHAGTASPTRGSCKEQLLPSSVGALPLVMVFTLLGTFCAPGGAGALDLNFDPGRGADDIVRAIVVEPSGSILIGGSFRSFDTNPCAGIVRLQPNGRMDSTFAPASDGLCNALALQTNGQILVGGQFSQIAGVARSNLARFHPGGAIDTNFAPAFAASDSVWAVAVQEDGRILVGGYLSGIEDTPINGITRLLPSGARDPEFKPGAGANGWVATIGLQADGSILVGGDFTHFAGHSRAGLARLWPDGKLDQQFDASVSGGFLRINSTLVQADGGIVIGGYFDSVQGVPRRGIARLDSAGVLDRQFAAAGGLCGFYGEIRSIVSADQGWLWVAGSFECISGGEVRGVARLLPDGQRDPEFAPCDGISGAVTRIAAQADGSLLLVGDFSYANHVKRYGIARLIGQAASVTERIPLKIRILNGSPHVRFNNPVNGRFTVEASADLIRWGAWVSGEFPSSSVEIPIPLMSMGERQFFRATVAAPR